MTVIELLTQINDEAYRTNISDAEVRIIGNNKTYKAIRAFYTKNSKTVYIEIEDNK